MTLITIVLGSIGVFILIWNGYVVFEWTEKWKAETAYEQSKSKTKRILILGDSQLEKWPIEHCLYSDLASYCREHDLGMVNAAHHGFGPIEYNDRHQHLGPDYDPDLILIFHYAGNDLSDVFYRKEQIPRQPKHNETYVVAGEAAPVEESPVAVQKDSGAAEKPMPVGNKFDWEKFKQSGIDSIYIEYAKNRIRYPSRIGTEYINPHLLVLASWKPTYLTDNILMESAESLMGWYYTLVQYESLLNEANEIGADVHFIVIPSTVQVDTSHNAMYRNLLFEVRDELVASTKPQARLKEFAEYSNAYFHDVLPLLEAQSNTEDLYFVNDDHLSAKGHQLIFEQVKKDILDPYLQDSDSLVASYRVDQSSNRYYKWKVEHEMDQFGKRITK